MVRDRVEKLVEAQPLPAWFHDARTLRFLCVNDALAAISGHSRRRLLSMKVTDICTIPGRSGRPARRKNGAGEFEIPERWRLRPRQGRAIEVRSASRNVRIRGWDAVLVVAQTIGRGAPGDAGAVATLPIGIFRSSPHGGIIDANPMFVRMLGYPNRDTLLAKRTADLYVESDARARFLAKLERNGTVMNVEGRLYRFDGSTIWVKANARMVRARAGGSDYVEGAIVDITDQKLAEARQIQQTAELQAFYDLSKRLRAARTADEMYPMIVEHARSLLDAYHGCLALLNPEHQVFTRAYTVGVVGEHTGSTFPSHHTRSGRVVADGKPVLVPDFSRERVPEWLDRGAYRPLGPLMIVPLRSETDVIGTLTVARAKGSEAAVFTDAEARLLEGVAEVAGIAIQRARLYQHVQDANVQMVVSLAQVIESRDSYTGRHSERVVGLAEDVARELGCPEREVIDIRWAARLHDIGKVGVPDALLRKPTTLTDEEWTVMRQHPLLGEEILNSVERMRGAAKLVRYHQESWDGTGYPDGLKGEAIPLGARILAVVDAFGAITEARPYRPARTGVQAVAELNRCAGHQFDPRVVEAFCAVIERRDPASPESPVAREAERPD
ncbi:MAG TPA: HD domain-containing phosphohydrolase [bacterium]|nr:HD domain-containing phosphohydrolase [bacterium]